MTKRKVLLVGWDGADWKVASPLVDQGKMPNLERLIDTGVMGNISTLYPVLSPMLWTSIATGKRAHKHGIHGFTEPNPVNGKIRPVTNLGRKCKAIWNILQQSGYCSNVVGWWPSHPAEPISGVMVSNHFQTVVAPLSKPWPLVEGTIHPAEKSNSLSKFRIHTNELTAQQLLPFIPNAAKIDQEKDKRISGVAKTLAEISSIHAVATAIMQHEPWDFMGIYYDGIDHFSHGFMKYHPPRMDWVSEEDFEIYQHVIESAYCFHDMMLGVLLKLAGPDTTVILMSDHGFHPDQLRPRSVGNEPAGAAEEHRQFGMLVINGPGIKKDELVFGASLLDITPTVLNLFDLPVAHDMDGRVLKDIFEQSPEIEFIDSWENVAGEDGQHPPGKLIDPLDSHESLKQLADLGYIELGEEDDGKATQGAVRELKYNVARDLMDCGQLEQASDALSELWDSNPDEGRFGVKLFFCYLRLEEIENAEATLERIIERKKQTMVASKEKLEKLKDEIGEVDANDVDIRKVRKLHKLARRASANPHTLFYLKGSLLFAKEEYEEALDMMERARSVQTHSLPSLQQKIANCLMKLERWGEAQKEFESVLLMDPTRPLAHLGMGKCCIGKRQFKKAISSIRSSLGLVHFNPAGHYLLGRCLAAVGRNGKAVSSLKTALHQNPGLSHCHLLLSELYSEAGDKSQAEKHRIAAQTIANRKADVSSKAGMQIEGPEDLTAMEESYGIGHILNDTDAFEIEDVVVVVSGLPRSGTSMMMQVLEAGGVKILADENRAADQSNKKGYFEYEPVKKLRENNSWLGESQGTAIKIVAPLLPCLLPRIRYRVIFMARPLGKTIESQSQMLANLNRPGASLSNKQLASTYRSQIDQAKQLLAGHSLVNTLTVDYERALINPEQSAALVNEFLGGSLDEAAMISAVDPQLRNH